MSAPASSHPFTGIYLVTDGGEHLPERVAAALAGGVSCLQYRDKSTDTARRREEGAALKALCARHGVCFIVNDDLQLARHLDADGVHLGQEDGCVTAARQLLGPGKLVGVSTHDLTEAQQAVAAGADYIGFGAMYPSRSKEVSRIAGPARLAAIRSAVPLPIVAIGGIDRDNAPAVIDAGTDAVAVISAVLGAAEPALACRELALLFNRRREFPRGAVLTVAGSDSGGGAGIQADLKTITLLGSYAASAITAITAQNTRGVREVLGLPTNMVAAQLAAVLDDIPIDVLKTGMLYDAGCITALAAALDRYRQRFTVVDPVMVAKGGASLLAADAVQALREQLLPRTYLLTPNLPEAEALTGLRISDEAAMAEAARRLHALGARNVLVKGGHLPGTEAVDLLFDGQRLQRFTAPHIASSATHGTGCTTAAAIATFLAQGEPLPVAVARAKEFITAAIRLAHPMGDGQGHSPVNHYLAARSMAAKK